MCVSAAFILIRLNTLLLKLLFSHLDRFVFFWSKEYRYYSAASLKAQYTFPLLNCERLSLEITTSFRRLC